MKRAMLAAAFFVNPTDLSATPYQAVDMLTCDADADPNDRAFAECVMAQLRQAALRMGRITTEYDGAHVVLREIGAEELRRALVVIEEVAE